MAKDQEPGSETDSELDFEELFADAADKAGAKGAAEENLDELEAFLDAFEKDPDSVAASNAPAAAPQPSSPVVDFSAPEHVEALVQGLLKDDDFDLEVAGKGAMPEATPEPALPQTSAAANLNTSVDNASSAMRTNQSPTPLAVAAVAMSTVALLLAIGAGWATFGARSDNTVAPAVDSVTASEIDNLKKRVSVLMEGPVGDITDSYPRDMDAIGKRVDDLQVALGAVEARLAAGPAAASMPDPEATGKGASKASPSTATAPALAAVNLPEATMPSAPNSETWQVNLVSFTERARAELELKRAQAQGMDVRIVPAQRDGRTWYRVAVAGFANADAARAYVGAEAKKAGYKAAWIAKP